MRAEGKAEKGSFTRAGLRVRIQNVVLTAAYEGIAFDPERLARALDGARYDPRLFPALACRSEDPPASLLIFPSGKVVCTGARSVGDARRAIEKLTRKLREAGVRIRSEPRVRVQNVVASFDSGRKVNLEELSRACEGAEYEPEIFPGLILRLERPRVAVLLFDTGKGICAGARTVKEVEAAAGAVARILAAPPGGG
jgi:transcription initiation factor TFIID TATA-box-binding protein